VSGWARLMAQAAAGQLAPLDAPCQRWVSPRQHSWRRTSEGGFNPRRYRVELIAAADAAGFVFAHHYAQSYPSVSLPFGLFEGRHQVGVCTLGVPGNEAVLTAPFPGLVPYRESMEISRLCLLDEVPANAESWTVARVLELAHKVLGVVAYSDPVRRVVDGRVILPGHVGGVYQALSFTPVGRSSAGKELHLPDGWVLAGRSVTKVRKGESGAGGTVARLRGYGTALPAYDLAAAARSYRPRSATCYGARWLAAATALLLAGAGAVEVVHPGKFRYVRKTGTPYANRRIAMPLAVTDYPKADQWVAS
jgi:hypothetical protein